MFVHSVPPHESPNHPPPAPRTTTARDSRGAAAVPARARSLLGVARKHYFQQQSVVAVAASRKTVPQAGSQDTAAMDGIGDET